MQLSVADVDFTLLDEQARDTLETVVPLLEDGKDHATIAAEFGVEKRVIDDVVAYLAAQIMRLSGRNEVPEHTDDEIQALADSIEAVGQKLPVLRGSPSSGKPGWIVDGRGRLRACAKLKIAAEIVDVDGTAEELERLALVLNVARRHLSASARRGLVKVELLRDATRSDRQIAIAVGVSPTTVGGVRTELERQGTVSKMDTRVGADGVAQAASKPQRVPTERAIRVLIPTDGFDEQVGPWIECRAFRFIERRPGVYVLHVQGDLQPATREQIDRITELCAQLAPFLGRTPEQALEDFVNDAEEVFQRGITDAGCLDHEAAAWAIDRMTEMVEKVGA
jgi:DNA-binding Lrp family transcriptional regulator